MFLLLPLYARPEEIYHIRRLSERELTGTYTSLLLDACRHANKVWQDSSADPRAGYWGSGRSDQMNEGIRAISGMVLTCGALLKYSDALNDSERHHYLTQATRAIRYAVASHLTGTQTCTDGKPWGGSWQSAMWTGTLAFGAWLIWDDLDSELRQCRPEPNRAPGRKPRTRDRIARAVINATVRQVGPHPAGGATPHRNLPSPPGIPRGGIPNFYLENNPALPRLLKSVVGV